MEAFLREQKPAWDARAGTALRIFLDLSDRSEQSANLRATAAARRCDLFVTSFGESAGGLLNINDCLLDPDFLQSQTRLAERADELFERWKGAPQRLALPIDGSRVQLFDHNLHEVHKWLYTVGRLVKSHPTSEIVAYLPNAPSRNRMYLYEAEGETSESPIRRLLYKRTDFLLEIIAQYLCGAGVAIDRYPWESWRRLGLWVRAAIRQYGVLLGSFAAHALNIIRHRKRHEKLVSPGLRAARTLMISRSSVHSDYLAPIVKIEPVAVLVADNFRSYPRNLDASASFFGDRPWIHLYDILSLGDLLRALLTTLAALLTYRREAQRAPGREVIEVEGTRVCLRQAFREAIVMGLEGAMVARGVDKLLRAAPEIRRILHCELFTHHAAYLASLGKHRLVDVHQVAFATYEMRPLPKFIFGNEFLCFSTAQIRSITKIWGEDSRLTYVGNPHLAEENQGGEVVGQRVRERASNRVIAYFSQPIFEDVERKLVDALVSTCEHRGYKLLIVMHPRDRDDKYDHLGRRALVMRNREYNDRRTEIECTLAFACTRTSNVSYFLLLRGIPVVNLLTSPHDFVVKQEYFEGYPLIGYDVGFMADLMDDPLGAATRFFRFRADFLRRSYDNLGVASFARFLRRNES